MKRDMDLIRQILTEIESFNGEPLGWINDLNIQGFDEIVISQHIRLLYEAGFIDAQDLTSSSGFDWKAKRLTWEGHEFLETIKNDTVWNKIKEQVKEKGGGISFEVLKALATQISTNLFLG